MTLPPVPDAFTWSDEAWGAALRCRPLAAVAPHVFAGRQLGLSGAAAAQLEASLGVSRVAMVTQVHGRTVVAADRESADSRPEADALVTRSRGLAVAVRTADCVPVLIADRSTGAVAAVHAGWRGTAAGIASAAVAALARQFGSRPADLVAAIGPSIGPCCYEVGPELVDAFAAAGHARHLVDRWFLALPPPRGSSGRPALRLDVAGANRDQLVLAGVPEEQVYDCGVCTAMHLDVLTSYRAEREQAGRMVAAIGAGAASGAS